MSHLQSKINGRMEIARLLSLSADRSVHSSDALQITKLVTAFGIFGGSYEFIRDDWVVGLTLGLRKTMC